MKDNWESKLEGWKKLFESGEILVTATSAAMANETVNLVKDGFRTETDPYGKRWKPKKRRDGRKTLSGETSQLKSGWHVRKNSKAGFLIAPTVAYAAYHQAPRRTSRLPRRMMVPRGGKLPKPWSDALKEVAVEVARAFYSTKGRAPAKPRVKKRTRRSK